MARVIKNQTGELIMNKIKNNNKTNSKFSKITALITAVIVFISTNLIVYAADTTDPVKAVDNFGTNLGKLISACGGIALLIGVVIVALGIASHDPSQKMTGGVVVGAGALLAFAPAAVNWFTTTGMIHLVGINVLHLIN